MRDPRQVPIDFGTPTRTQGGLVEPAHKYSTSYPPPKGQKWLHLAKKANFQFCLALIAQNWGPLQPHPQSAKSTRGSVPSPQGWEVGLAENPQGYSLHRTGGRGLRVVWEVGVKGSRGAHKPCRTKLNLLVLPYRMPTGVSCHPWERSQRSDPQKGSHSLRGHLARTTWCKSRSARKGKVNEWF